MSGIKNFLHNLYFQYVAIVIPYIQAIRLVSASDIGH
jgi:hypothetical protein